MEVRCGQKFLLSNTQIRLHAELENHIRFEAARRLPWHFQHVSLARPAKLPRSDLLNNHQLHHQSPLPSLLHFDSLALLALGCSHSFSSESLTQPNSSTLPPSIDDAVRLNRNQQLWRLNYLSASRSCCR